MGRNTKAVSSTGLSEQVEPRSPDDIYMMLRWYYFIALLVWMAAELCDISAMRLSNARSYWSQRLDSQINSFYTSASTIKCPFFRRRSLDILDHADSVVNFIVARHKSIPLFYTANVKAEHLVKATDLALQDIALMIFEDWKAESGKGYYITGRLTRSIYAEDCFFDGPDVDMPVKGLQKYLLSASQLFSHKHSKAELTGPLEVGARAITARWRIEGVLNLPWKPHMKPWTGRTVYYINADGLIDRHVEEWDISVLDAFVSLLLPSLCFGAPPAPAVTADLSAKYIVGDI